MRVIEANIKPEVYRAVAVGGQGVAYHKVVRFVFISYFVEDLAEIIARRFCRAYFLGDEHSAEILING